MTGLDYTKTSSRDDWLTERRKAIGGSDAAAIVGLNDYSSAFEVWLDKLGRLPEKEDTEAMRQGRDLEAYVAERFSEATGKKVRRENRLIRNSKYPFAHANIDRRIVGENAGLECKTTKSLNLKKFKNGEFPAHYYVQCMHYMAITGMEKYYLAVLVYGSGFFWYEIERDEEIINDLMQTEADFWEMVEKEIPPEVDGSDATAGALAIYYDEPDDAPVEIVGMNGLAKEYKELKEQEKDIRNRLECIKQEFGAYLGNSTVGYTSDFKITNKLRNHSNLDRKAINKDYPDLDFAKYTVVKPNRKKTVDIKELKK